MHAFPVRSYIHPFVSPEFGTICPNVIVLPSKWRTRRSRGEEAGEKGKEEKKEEEENRKTRRT